MGEYECQHLNPGISRKAKWIHPRSEPDSGNPTVRDRRGAAGNVAYSKKCARLLSIPTIHKLNKIKNDWSWILALRNAIKCHDKT